MTSLAWSPDILDGYEATTLAFPDDYDGAVVATLVRRRTTTDSTKAMLWIHGFSDYFFHTHVGDAFIEQGYNVYALDFRKYGRSLRAHQHPNMCKSVVEYFPEITEVLRIIREVDGNDSISVIAHSTGGLVMSIYAAVGEKREYIHALSLNSPFFDWNLTPFARNFIRMMSFLAVVLPTIPMQGNDDVPYLIGLHQDYEGEWDFDLAWRPLKGFPVYSGWARAISEAQEQVRAGLAIHCPVLLMCSDKVIHGSTYTPDFDTGDSILNPAHIKQHQQYLGDQVELAVFDNGIHDLYLSSPAVREKVFRKTFAWLDTILEETYDGA